jgi:hypothetical protein
MLLRVENPSFIVAAIACHPQKSWKAKDDGGFGSRRPLAAFGFFSTRRLGAATGTSQPR